MSTDTRDEDTIASDTRATDQARDEMMRWTFPLEDLRLALEEAITTYGRGDYEGAKEYLVDAHGLEIDGGSDAATYAIACALYMVGWYEDWRAACCNCFVPEEDTEPCDTPEEMRASDEGGAL